MINATIFLRLTGVSLFTTKRVMQNGNSRDNGFVFHCLYAKFAKPCGNRNKKARLAGIGWKGQAAGTSVAFYDERSKWFEHLLLLVVTPILDANL